MKKLLSAVLAAFLSIFSINAQVSDTLIVENPGKVVVVKTDSLQTVEIVGRNGDENYRFSSAISLDGNGIATTSITQKLDFDTFLTKYNGKKENRSKSTWSLIMIDNIGLGWSGTVDRAAGVGYHAMFLGDFWVPDVLGIRYEAPSGWFVFRTGIGYNRRCLRVAGHNYWEKENDLLVIRPVSDENRLKHSRLYVRSLTLPVLFTFKLGPKHRKSIMLGPELSYNFQANAVTRYVNTDGDRVTHKISGLKPEHFNVGLVVSSNCLLGIPLYFRWQPANIFDGVKGPKMGYYSFGLLL